MTPKPRARTNQISRRIERAVRAVLPRTVKVKIRPTGSGYDLTLNGVPLEVKWAGEGWLRQVRPLLGSRSERPDLFVARRMSPGARRAISKAGIGWIDESGAAELAIRSLIVSRTGQPESHDEKSVRWTPSVLAVAEALLCNTKPTVKATADVTGLSTGSCAVALHVLTDLALLKSAATRGRRSARHIVDGNDLLEAYASAAARLRPKMRLQVGVTWKDMIGGLGQAGHAWKQAGFEWAVTGAAASQVVAPFLTSLNSAEVYVEAKTLAELQAVAGAAGLRPIEGGRLTLMPFPTVTSQRLANRADGLRVAPWPRIYADLRTRGVRGEEAAEHLREVLRGR